MNRARLNSLRDFRKINWTRFLAWKWGKSFVSSFIFESASGSEFARVAIGKRPWLTCVFFFPKMWFPTWWTAMPDTFPIITGWAPWQSAERLESESVPVVTRALQTLGGLLGVGNTEMERFLEIAYFHDWQADPYSRGAYSYVKVGSADAPEGLSRPVKDTLFFAGEAADITGNNGTVHGAIASARRAVIEIARTRRASAAD